MVFSHDNTYWNFSDRRVSRLLTAYGAEGEANYAQAYATAMSPLDYLSLTCSDVEAFLKDAKPLDYDKLCAEGQEIYLRVNMDTGEILGHEGRHRMAALYKAGAKKVAISLVCAGEEGRYNRMPLDSLALVGQDFPELSPPCKASGEVTVKKLIPFSEACKWDLRSYYGPKPALKSYVGKWIYEKEQINGVSDEPKAIGVVLSVSDNADSPSMAKWAGWQRYVHFINKDHKPDHFTVKLRDFLSGMQSGKYRPFEKKAPALDAVIAECNSKKDNSEQEAPFDFMAAARKNAGLDL